MLHGVRKSLKEAGDKVADDERQAIESAATDLEEAVKGDDAEAITEKTSALATASHKLAEQMYAQADAASEGPADAGSPEDDNVVDAEFEEVKDDDKKDA
jgi:molecular chaperone DnaK